MASPNGGIIGVVNPTSFGKCTQTVATSSTSVTTQPGTRLVAYAVVAGGGGSGSNPTTGDEGAGGGGANGPGAGSGGAGGGGAEGRKRQYDAGAMGGVARRCG